MAHYELTTPVTEEQVRRLHAGDTVTLQDTLFGIRDATQIHILDRGRTTRVDLDDLNPESLWKFRIRGFGPLLVGMDSHGNSLYTGVKADVAARRAEVLAGLGVRA